jgi:hypothetical protein
LSFNPYKKIEQNKEGGGGGAGEGEGGEYITFDVHHL